MKTSRWLSSDSCGSGWAATVATYCLGRITEHLKSKSTGGFHWRDGSPCTRQRRPRPPQWSPWSASGCTLCLGRILGLELMLVRLQECCREIEGEVVSSRVSIPKQKKIGMKIAMREFFCLDMSQNQIFNSSRFSSNISSQEFFIRVETLFTKTRTCSIISASRRSLVKRHQAQGYQKRTK